MKILEIAHKTKTAVLIVGRYGVGKTSIPYQYANDNRFYLEDLKLSQFDAISLRGPPETEIKDGIKITTWPIGDMFYRLSQHKEGAVLLLDEFDKATPSVASASYELLLQRRYGNFVLADNVLIVATSNLESEDFRSEGFSIPQLDRLLKVELAYQLEDWLAYAKNKGIDSRIIEFISTNPSRLWREGQPESFTTTSPRGWERLSHLLQNVNNLDVELIETLAGALVGSDIASEFIEFINEVSWQKIYINNDMQKLKNLDLAARKLVIKQAAQDVASDIVKSHNAAYNLKLTFITNYCLDYDDLEFAVLFFRGLKLNLDSFDDFIRSYSWPRKTELLTKITAFSKNGGSS